MSEYDFTSAVSCFICADDVEGGGPGRSATISAGVMAQARTWPKNGSIGGRAGVSWLSQGISPFAFGGGDERVPLRPGADRVAHPVAGGARGEDGGHGLAEGQAGRDVAGGGAARPEGRVALVPRLAA